jgi:hypothetical protein
MDKLDSVLQNLNIGGGKQRGKKKLKIQDH